MALASDADGFITGGQPLDLGAALELWRAVRADIGSIKEMLRRDGATPDAPEAPRETPPQKQREPATSVAALPSARETGRGTDALARALEAVAAIAPRQAPDAPAAIPPSSTAAPAQSPERAFGAGIAAQTKPESKRTETLLGGMLAALGAQEDSLEKGFKRLIDAIEDLTDATRWAKDKDGGGLLDKLPGGLGKAGKLLGRGAGAAAKAGKGLLGKAGKLLGKIPIKGAGILAPIMGAIGLASDFEAADADATLTDRGRTVKKGEAVGKFGGTMGGAAAGAMAGAVAGPPGMLVGSLIGGIIGAWGGSKAGGAITDAVLAPEAPGTQPGPAGARMPEADQGAAPGTATQTDQQASRHAPTQADRRASRGGDRTTRQHGEAVAPSSIERILETGKGYNVVERADGSQVRQKGSRNWRNNNPGNIEYGDFAKSKGAIGTDGRFAIFPTKEAGREAKSSLIFEGKNYRDKTLEQAIARYAPPSENNTKRYQSEVLKAAGGQNKRMADYTPQERSAIMDAMERVEGYKEGETEVIRAATKSPEQMAAAQQAPSAAQIPPATTQTAPAPQSATAPQAAAAPAQAPATAQAAPTPEQAAAAREVLQSRRAHKNIDVDNIDADMAVKVAAFTQDIEAQTGRKIQVQSGYRPPTAKEKAAVGSHGNTQAGIGKSHLVAGTYSSMHGRGEAVDLKFADGSLKDMNRMSQADKDRWFETAQKHDLNLPMLGGEKGKGRKGSKTVEWWHLEPNQTANGKRGDLGKRGQAYADHIRSRSLASAKAGAQPGAMPAAPAAMPAMPAQTAIAAIPSAPSAPSAPAGAQAGTMPAVTESIGSGRMGGHGAYGGRKDEQTPAVGGVSQDVRDRRVAHIVTGGIGAAL